jgi:hypothetical protein
MRRFPRLPADEALLIREADRVSARREGANDMDDVPASKRIGDCASKAIIASGVHGDDRVAVCGVHRSSNLAGQPGNAPPCDSVRQALDQRVPESRDPEIMQANPSLSQHAVTKAILITLT